MILSGEWGAGTYHPLPKFDISVIEGKTLQKKFSNY